MSHLFCIGGTRFVGRHAVTEFLEHGYEVTLFNRGTHDNPFADDDRVSHVEGDRTNEGELRLAVERADPDVVVDTVAYFPRDVRVATEVCGDVDVDAYVYVSSGASYRAEEIPKREDETALNECTTEQATEDSAASYGPRKAEGDRAVFAAAERGVNAMVVRPPVVYGPYDYTERFDYWIDRVLNHDRIVVPGDGTNLWQKVYVEDVASALRIAAEEGDPGEAYNVGDEDAPTLGEWIARIATPALALETPGARLGVDPPRGVPAADHRGTPRVRPHRPRRGTRPGGRRTRAVDSGGDVGVTRRRPSGARTPPG